MTPLEVLRTIPALAELSKSDFDVLAAAIEFRDYPDGYVFIREGKRGDAAYVVVAGTVAVTHERGGNVVELNRLGPGSLFGLVALVDDEPRSATCRAVGVVTAGTLASSAFALLFNAHAPIAFALQRALAEQLAHDFRNLDRKLRVARVQTWAMTDEAE